MRHNCIVPVDIGHRYIRIVNQKRDNKKPNFLLPVGFHALDESFNQNVMAHKSDQHIGACDRVLQPSGTHPLSSDVESESNRRYPNLGKGLRIVKKANHNHQPRAK